MWCQVWMYRTFRKRLDFLSPQRNVNRNMLYWIFCTIHAKRKKHNRMNENWTRSVSYGFIQKLEAHIPAPSFSCKLLFSFTACLHNIPSLSASWPVIISSHPRDANCWTYLFYIIKTKWNPSGKTASLSDQTLYLHDLKFQCNSSQRKCQSLRMFPCFFFLHFFLPVD